MTALLRRSGRERIAELERILDAERLRPSLWVNRRVRDRFGDSVRSGPFAGLEYPDWAMSVVDGFSCKLLGTYERELHAAVEAAIAARPRQVVNIGAGDGYYAVGLASRLPDASIHAFESNETTLSTAVAIAEHNGVRDRIEVALACDPAALAAVLEEDALVVSDCEGAERDLLDPAAVPALASADMIVEVHDHHRPGTGEALRERFGATHELTEIPAAPRWVEDHPELDFMPLQSRQIAICEFREGPMGWLVCRPGYAAG